MEKELAVWMGVSFYKDKEITHRPKIESVKAVQLPRNLQLNSVNLKFIGDFTDHTLVIYRGMRPDRIPAPNEGPDGIEIQYSISGCSAYGRDYLCKVYLKDHDPIFKFIEYDKFDSLYDPRYFKEVYFINEFQIHENVAKQLEQDYEKRRIQSQRHQLESAPQAIGGEGLHQNEGHGYHQ
jgi:hypothetical protein